MSRITIYSKKEVARVDFNPLDSSIAYIIESESNDKWVVYMFKSVIDGSVILNTKITSGKNIPFGRAEVIISKTIFASDESFGVWTVENPKPILKAGVTLIDIETFGTATKYLVTNVKMDESLVVISASHPSYKLTYTNVDDVFNKMFKVKRVYEDSYSGVTEVKKPLWALFATGTNFNSKYKEIIFKKSDDTFVRFVNKGTNYTLKATEYRVIVESGDAIISSDQRMASINKGCQKQYVSGGFNLTYGPEYNISTNTTSNISKYASGVGFEGDYGVVDADCPAFDKFTFWYSADEIDIIFHIATVEISEAGGRSSKVEWIEGRADDIIRFLIKYALDYPVYPQYFTRATTYYPNPGDLGSKVTDAIKNEYSTRELVDAVTRGPVFLIDSSNEEFLICVEEDTTSEVYSPYYGTPIGEAATIIASTERIRMRVNGVLSCGTLLANIAKATNRKFSFSDEGFFMTGDEKYYTAVKYSKGANDEISASITVLQPINGVLLDTDSYSEEEFIDGLQTHTIKSERVVNIPVVVDNGAESIIGSQQVEAENYKVTVENSSDDSNPKGKTIEFPLADSRGGKKYRDAMAKICAYNVLVNEYQVKDNVLYDTSEVRDSASSFHGEEKYGRKHFISLYELEQYSLIKLPPNGSFALVMPSMVEVEYVYTGGQWVISIPDDEATSEEINAPPKYEIYSVSKKVKDNYNEVVINNAPLIQVSRSYPGYVTQFMWGKGVTVNTITKTKELHESSIFDKSSANEDTRISEKNSAMLIMGNQTPNELNSNNNSMFGYTGLTIGKDVGSDIYGMKGYNKGVLQAEFNSQGKISAGGGSIILDEHGLTMGEGDSSITVGQGGFHAGPVTLDNTGVYVNDSETPPNKKVWMNADGFKAGGILLSKKGLSANGKVLMNEYGLASDDKGVFVNQDGIHLGKNITSDADGELILVGNHIQMGIGGIQIGSSVLIDSWGMVIGPKPMDIPAFGEPIDEVAGQVYIDADGIKVKDINANPPYDKVRMNSGGFHVGKGDNTVTMDEEGVHAGAVLMDFKGMRIKDSADVDYIDINQNGFFVGPDTPPVGEVVKSGQVSLTSAGVKAGKVTLNSTGLLVDDVDGKVTITKDGLKAGDGSVHLHKTGLTVGNVANRVTLTMDGVKAGKVTLNSTGLLVDDEVGKVTITKDGLNAGKVTLNSTGLLVDDEVGKVTITKDGLNAGKVTLNNAGLLVDDVNGKITITKDGLNAGKVTLNNAGLLVDDVNGKITITKDGLKAGTVTLNNAGVNVNSKVYMNANGIEVAGHVLMNETGFIVGTGVGKVTMDSAGVKAGSVHLHSTGLNVGSGANLVTMTDQGVKAGTVTLNNAGVNVNSKVYLNANGIEVAGHVLMNETGFTVGVGTGKVTMNSTGVHAGDVTLNSSGLQAGNVTIGTLGITIGDATNLVTMGAGGITAGDVIIDGSGVYVANKVYMNGDGFTVGTGPGKVTMNGSGVHAGDVTLNSLGVQAGYVKLNSNGLEVTDEVFINKSGFYSHGEKITINNGGLQVGAHVKMDEDGVEAGGGFVKMNQQGFFVGNADNLVKMDSGGITAGNVYITKSGINVNNKVLINQSGVGVAGHVLMNETGFTVGAGPGEVTMNGTGVHAGSVHLHSTGLTVGSGANLVTMTDQGVKAGTVTLNNAGVNVNSKVYLNANGIEVAGHVLMNETGFTVGVGTGKVTMDGTGVKAGNTVLDSNGFHIVSNTGTGFAKEHVLMNSNGLIIGPSSATAGKVTVNKDGLTAGSVNVNNAGVYVANKVYMNGDGFIVGTNATNGAQVKMNATGVHAGNTLLDANGFHVLKNAALAPTAGNTHITMKSTGVHAGSVTLNSDGIDVDGKVSMGTGGVKAGTTLLNSNGFYVLKNTTDGVTVANTHVSMGSGGVKAGPVTLSSSGVSVSSQAFMNANGFIVGTNATNGAQVKMNATGVHAGNTLLDANGFHVLADASKAPTVTGNTLVTMNDLGFTVSSNTSLDANLDTRAVKFRLDASNTDVARIYAGRGGVGAATKNVLNIQSYNAGANKGLLRIYNKYVDNDNTYEFKSLKTMDGNMSILSSTETTDFSPILEHTSAIVSIVGIETGRIVNFKMIFSGVNGFVGAVDTKQSIKWLLKRQPHLDCVVMRNGDEEVDIPAATGKFQVIEIPMDHKNTKSLEFNFTHNRPLEFHSLSFANFTFNDESDSGGTIEIDENYINLNGTVKINGLLDGGLTLGSETVHSLVDASIVAIAERLFPVGYIYTTLYNDNPGNRFGGVWVPYAEGRTLAGLDINDPQFNKAGYGGGTKTHTLSESEMPQHFHLMEIQASGAHGHSASSGTTGNHAHSGTTASSGTHNHTVRGVAGGEGVWSGGCSGGGRAGDKATSSDGSHTHTFGTNTTGDHSHTITVNGVGNHGHSLTLYSAGGNQPHNNLQPYVTVYMFLRVS